MALHLKPAAGTDSPEVQILPEEEVTKGSTCHPEDIILDVYPHTPSLKVLFARVRVISWTKLLTLQEKTRNWEGTKNLHIGYPTVNVHGLLS